MGFAAGIYNEPSLFCHCGVCDPYHFASFRSLQKVS
jgi:hypothetical protein